MISAANSTRRDSGVVPLLGRNASYFCCTNQTYQRHHCRSSQHSLSPMPLLLSFFLHVMWLIRVLCHSRCPLAAAFHDVELAATWRVAWHVSSALFNMCKLAIKFGFEWPLIWRVHQLSGRRELMRISLQHSAFDWTVNNRLIALSAYSYSSSTDVSASGTGKPHSLIMINHPCFTGVRVVMTVGTLKPVASCAPDTLAFNLLRAVLDFAVLHVTSSLAVAPRQPPAEAAELVCRLQSCVSAHMTGSVCFLAWWDWKRTSMFF